MNVSLEKIFEIDGGESYILSIYPELEPCFRDPKRKVKLRDEEKTPSTGVFKHKTSGYWLVKDFGSGDTAKNAFTICMEVNRCDSSEAFKILAKFYGFENSKVTPPSPTYSSRLPREGELPQQIVNVTYKDLDYHEALTILSKNAWSKIEFEGKEAKTDEERLNYARLIFKYYNFRVLHSYEQVSKDGSKVHIFTANKDFPMYEIAEEYNGESFGKIYKPRAEKKYRFLWRGKKPEDFIHGLKQHENFLEGNRAANEKTEAEGEAKGKDVEDKLLPEKFNAIILCTGGSDALNAAAMGYRVIWPNSETAKLGKKDFKRITKLCHDFYNLPDIDHTGRTAARDLAWEYIDIKTIWLPNELTKRSDGKGGYCKDLRDYLKYWSKYDFRILVKNALPFRFWDEMPKVDKEGNLKFKFGRQLYEYEFNNVRGYNFLQMSGYWRYEEPKMKEGYFMIKIQENIVSKVLPNDVKNYIHTFLKDRQYPEDLRNHMYRSTQLSESSFSNLEMIDLNFKNFDKDHQLIFFENKNWKVTASGIEAVKRPDIYVWEHKLIKPKTSKGELTGFEPKIIEPAFSISQEGEGWNVTFKPQYRNCDFLLYLLQTCKIHWRKELEERMEFYDLSEKQQADYLKENDLPESVVEVMKQMTTKENRDAYEQKYKFRLDGSLLTEEEIAEQKLCFVNRVFAIGYLLHRYKDPTKPWAVFMMDYRVSEEGASNGRAGKGLMSLALKKMLDHVRIDGRDPLLFNNQFLFGGVERGNELIHIEDWNEFLDFERLFNFLTGSLYSNKKGMQAVDIENQDFGKFLIDTNFADRYMSGSAKGRKLHCVFADYYHEDLEYYREVRTPATELGRRMYDEWEYDQWNQFYNFMAHCLSFYLSVANKGVKIDPPFSNIVKRNSLAVMGENFRQWADNYFESRFGEDVRRTEAFEDMQKAANNQKITPQGFLKKLLAWCEFYGYKFNPEDVNGWCKAGEGKKYGYIKRSVPTELGKHTTVEFIHIRKPTAKPVEQMPF